MRAALYDMRRSSPTRGASLVQELGGEAPFGLYIPRGVAHGFYALVPFDGDVPVDQYFDNSDERGIRSDDPALGIDWGARDPIVSARDQENPPLARVPANELPE